MSKARGSGNQNISLLLNVSQSDLPVNQDMPIAKAELSFHEYVPVCDNVLWWKNIWEWQENDY